MKLSCLSYNLPCYRWHCPALRQLSQWSSCTFVCYSFACMLWIIGKFASAEGIPMECRLDIFADCYHGAHELLQPRRSSRLFQKCRAMGCASANDPSMYQVFSITSWPVSEWVCVWDSMGQLYRQHFHLPASQPCCGLLLVSLWPPGKVQSFPWLVFAVSWLY